jgi:membrane-bound lytic murein transglycosylase D
LEAGPEKAILKTVGTKLLLFLFAICLTTASLAAIPSTSTSKAAADASTTHLTLKERLEERLKKTPRFQTGSVIFDLPVTYNRRVSYWISYFQANGKTWFRDWLERSSRYMPFIQKDLKNAGLPQDLAFMVMIESGFEPNAISHADAVGPWQFIQPTGERYGLHVKPWLDERRDLRKSTLAAIRYLKDLHQEFGSWYLVAASYNMGESGLRKQIARYGSKDFWTLSRVGALPKETIDYVPKILAAMMIAKAPNLYGFSDLAKFDTYEYDVVMAPGGTDLKELAEQLGVTEKSLKDMNAELIRGYVPSTVDRFPIRVPRGSVTVVAEFFKDKSAHE